MLLEGWDRGLKFPGNSSQYFQVQLTHLFSSVVDLSTFNCSGGIHRGRVVSVGDLKLGVPGLIPSCGTTVMDLLNILFP